MGNCGNKIVTLTELLDLLPMNIPSEELEKTIYQNECGKIKKSFEDYKNIRRKFQPLIEKNRYLVQRFSENHQETFRFWQSIAAESEATYSEGGEARIQATKPTLRVRT